MNAAQIRRGITKIAHNPWKLFSYLSETGIFNWLDDETYIRLKYRGAFAGKKLNLENPQTYNEKLQWLKLHDRKPEYTRMVDKYEVKQYIAEKIGAEYVIPTLGVWECFEDINFDALPDQFVLKCTHNSGGLVICKNKSALDINDARKTIEKSLKTNYYFQGREWPYKDVKPQIIAEPYVEDDVTKELRDYKFQFFNGVLDHILVCVGRNSMDGVKYYYFDPNWNYLPYALRNSNINDEVMLQRPRCFEKMVNIATILAQDIPTVRVDLYECNDAVLFGELTFFTQSGFDTSITEKADDEIGRRLILPIQEKR